MGIGLRGVDGGYGGVLRNIKADYFFPHSSLQDVGWPV